MTNAFRVQEESQFGVLVESRGQNWYPVGSVYCKSLSPCDVASGWRNDTQASSTEGARQRHGPTCFQDVPEKLDTLAYFLGHLKHIRTPYSVPRLPTTQAPQGSLYASMHGCLYNQQAQTSFAWLLAIPTSLGSPRVLCIQKRFQNSQFCPNASTLPKATLPSLPQPSDCTQI